METSTVFRGLYNRIQNNLIEEISSGLLVTTKNETKNFLVVLFDDTTDVSNKARFSVVLHEKQQRFLGLTDISCDRHAKNIAELYTCLLYTSRCV